MSRFRLYGSGGRPIYDSDGEADDRRLERIKREFNAGVAAFYDPGAGLVRIQVNIHRRSPEQFVATYQSGTDEALLSPLFDRLRALSARREWTIQRASGGTQALYDALDDGSAFDPDSLTAVERGLAEQSVGPADIQDAVDDLGAVDLAVPDYDTAAATLAHVTETFEGYAVAVSESTAVETIAGADVIVRPTGNVDRVTPGPEFSAWLDRRRAAAATAAIDDAVESAAAGFESASVPVATGVAAAVDRADITAELGVRAVPSSPPAVTRRELRRTLSYGLPSGVAVGAAVGVAWSGGVGSVSRWLLAVGSLLVAAVWAGALLAVVAGDGPDRSSDPPAVDADPAAVGDAVSRVAAVIGPDAAREALASALEPYGVTIEPAGDRDRQRRRAIGAGVVASAGAGALALVVVAILLPSGLV
ncbi:hypothetical protein GCM10008995_03440 [Halobellus salinus]|uniref:Uncharacterized protein n=1 Tax=Halobellus salinus TaxID=931585 RepID=A0A830EK34_9EURY|nr:hypothetical protein [Halobellus salinus]GGI96733.1 hypothetical protein GCM10008995_03440 [Halobellus salinus]SMP13416.1 hypothetical protein SAMN06265347_104193 [Halobellus salinus]